MSAPEVEAMIRAQASPEVLAEIQYFVDLDVEDGQDYTFIDGWNMVLDRVDTDPDLYNAKFLKDVRRIGIVVGSYRHVPDSELAGTYVSYGKAYDFILDGKKYIFDENNTNP